MAERAWGDGVCAGVQAGTAVQLPYPDAGWRTGGSVCAEPCGREFGVMKDKVGVWGFSAGGHLAGYLATIHDQGNIHSPDVVERVSDRPDFVILSYARLSTDASIPRETNLEGLLGDHPTPEALKAMSIERLVTKDTSPSFIYSTTGDQTVNSLAATYVMTR